MKNSKHNFVYICIVVAIGITVWGVGKLFLLSPASPRSDSDPKLKNVEQSDPDPVTVSIESNEYSSSIVIPNIMDNADIEPVEEPNLVVRGQNGEENVPLIPQGNPIVNNPLRDPDVVIPSIAGPMTEVESPILLVNHTQSKEEEETAVVMPIPPSLPMMDDYPSGPIEPAILAGPDTSNPEFGPIVPVVGMEIPEISETGSSSSNDIIRIAPGVNPMRRSDNIVPPAIPIEYDPLNEIEPLPGMNPLNNAQAFEEPSVAPVGAGRSEEFLKTANAVRNDRLVREPSVTVAGEREIIGTGTPGHISLEGAQVPQLHLEKIAPPEVIIDQPALFRTVVKNVGKVTARNVKITDKIPLGTRLHDTTPRTSPKRDGEIVWELGNIEPNQEKIAEMRVVPGKEGEIGSVATVSFSAESSAKTVVTRPMLKLEVKAPDKVTIGESVTFEITITNPGTGPANGVVLQEIVPDGLVHAKGKELINKIGTIKPKDSRRYSLTMQAVKSGPITNYLSVRGDYNLAAEDKSVVNVLAPNLDLKISGSKQRFLERKAVYKLTVANPGTSVAENVDLVLALPSGLKFESTDCSGVYDPKTHKVHWALESLPVNKIGEIELVTIPVKTGDQSMTFTGEGSNQLAAEVSHAVNIDGLAATSFSVECLSNPVELGKEAVYEVTVTNRGTKTASNITMALRLSQGMTFMNAEGPTTHRNEKSVLQFEPLAALEPKKERVYKITARCDAPGDHRILVQVVSDDLQQPITKEESTKVFVDK